MARIKLQSSGDNAKRWANMGPRKRLRAFVEIYDTFQEVGRIGSSLPRPADSSIKRRLELIVCRYLDILDEVHDRIAMRAIASQDQDRLLNFFNYPRLNDRNYEEAEAALSAGELALLTLGHCSRK